MHLYSGTSGYSYPAWRGSFCPEKLPPGRILGEYARQLEAVEINNTFYRMPKASVIEKTGPGLARKLLRLAG